MKKLIIMDLDNFLYPTSKQVQDCRKAAVKTMVSAGLPLSFKETLILLEEIVKEYGPNHQGHYDLLVEEVFTKKELAATDKRKTYIVGNAIDAYHEKKNELMKPYDNALPTINTLLGRGYDICMLTKGVPKKQWAKIRRLGLDRVFTYNNTWIALDNELKEDKIKDIMNHYKLGPEEIVICGDRVDSEIKAGKKLGITTIQLKKGPYKDLKGIKPDYEIETLSSLLELDILKNKYSN
jgi:putative hydrolase of the HAD superfamily